MKKPLISFLNRSNLLALCCLCLLSGLGCGGDEPMADGPKVATYQDRNLHLGEVRFHLPDSMATEDSLRLAEKYVQSWIESQAVREKAERVMPDLESRIRYRLQAYERSLIEQEYARYVLAQNEDKLKVSEAEVRTYYEENPEKFKSRTSYYQFFYIKTELSGQYKVGNLLRSNDTEKIQELMTWASENAVEYKLDSTYLEAAELERIGEGYYFGDIKRASRGTVYPYGHREKKAAEGEEETETVMYYDFFKMIDVIEPGELLPLDMVRQRIELLMRNKRKQTLIDQHFKDLARQVQAGGQAQILK